jgi:hypothetical protein
MGIAGSNEAVTRLPELSACFRSKGMIGFLTLHVLMDELERFTHDDPEGKSYISSQMVFHISQLSVISECLHQFHLYQPWAKQVERAMMKRKMSLLDSYTAMLRPFTPMIILRLYQTRL